MNCDLIWNNIPESPKDKILYYDALYKKDKNPNKVNMTNGCYQDENGESWVLPCVREATEQLFASKDFKHDYIPMGGDKEFMEKAVVIAYGEKNGLLSGKYKQSQVAKVQSLSGSGGIYLAYQLVNRFYKDFSGIIFTPEPTWPIHNSMAKMHGFTTKTYRYYDLDKRVLNFEGMKEDFANMPERSVIVLQPVGNNPTGFDPSPKQWRELLEITLRRKFMIFFDMPYQGFVSGDYDKDAYAVRLFTENGANVMVAQSFAKNFGLYGQRVGCLSIPVEDEGLCERMSDFLAFFTRNTHSSCPRFGSDVIRIILNSQELTNQWKKDLITMSSRMKRVRRLLLHRLQELGSKHDWSFLVQQQGMFAFTFLTKEQVTQLRERFSVYMLDSGRICVCGLNDSNIDYTARALISVTCKDRSFK